MDLNNLKTYSELIGKIETIAKEKIIQGQGGQIAEEYIRKIIYKGIDWFVKNKPLSEGQFKNLLFPIDDINFYFRKTRYTFYTKEYFEYYFSTDIFKLDRDNNMFLEAYFQMLMN